MLNGKKIKSFFDEGIKKRRMDRMQQGLNVSKIWMRILLIFVIANVVIIGFSIYLFFQINSGEIFLVEKDTNVSVETIDRALLRDTIDLFEMKEVEFGKLKEEKPKIIDPSL